MVPERLREAMPRTITLKNIPDNVYERLKMAAQAHRRSINGEVIATLEQAVMPRRIITAEERIERARAIRESLGDIVITDNEIDAAKREGRL